LPASLALASAPFAVI